MPWRACQRVVADHLPAECRLPIGPEAAKPQRTCQRKGWREARHRGRIILVFGEKPRMLTFSCKENWDRMPTVDNGRFCQKCQHAVFDFTSWDRRSMLAYLELHPDTCGQYRPEQLEPDLIPLSELLSLKKAALVAGLTLGTIQVSAQAQAPPPTEQTVPTPGSDFQPLHDDQAITPTEKPDGISGTCPRPMAEPTEPRRAPRNHLYVSSRFPFFFVRRGRTKGRMRRQRLIF